MRKSKDIKSNRILNHEKVFILLCLSLIEAQTLQSSNAGTLGYIKK